MNDKQTFKAAFDAVRAPQDWKEGVFARMEREAARTKRPSRRRWAVAAAVACFVCLIFGGCTYFAMPVSYLSIDINPSLQLGINRLDRVVTVTGYNREGEQLASSLHLLFRPYADALEEIMSAQDTRKYLKKDLPVTIAVESDNEEKGEEMLETVSHCANAHHHGNVSCSHADPGLAQEARSLGISLGKYQVYLELQALDPSITPQEAQSLTMRELRERIAALSPNGTLSSEPAAPAEETSPTPSPSPTASMPCENETGSCMGNGSGNGAGNGNGSGMGNGGGQGKGHGKGQGKGQGHGRGHHNEG